MKCKQLYLVILHRIRFKFYAELEITWSPYFILTSSWTSEKNCKNSNFDHQGIYDNLAPSQSLKRPVKILPIKFSQKIRLFLPIERADVDTQTPRVPR